jgi:hypothetical protein
MTLMGLLMDFPLPCLGSSFFGGGGTNISIIYVRVYQREDGGDVVNVCMP